MMTLKQVASLKRDAYKPNWGSKSYSPQTVIDLIEVIEAYAGEMPVESRRPRDPFDLRYQVDAGPLADSGSDQMGLFDFVADGNFSNNWESRERAMGDQGEPLFL